MGRLSLLFLFILIFSINLHGQNATLVWEDYISQQIESGGMSEEDGAEIMERWIYLSRHPLNLNTLTRTDLEQFPFINEFQIHHFFLYRHAHPEGFSSIWALKEINGWDRQTCLRLWPMVCVQEISQPMWNSIRDLFTHGRHETWAVSNVILQKQNGYRPTEKAPYKGSPWGGGLRWNYSTGRSLSVGLTAEKDRGEPAFNSVRKGFDSYSAHLFIENRGSIRSIALGDYRIGMGYGLLMDQSAFMGMAYANPRGGSKLRRAFSFAEDNYLRGGAATLGDDRFTLTTFYSRKNIDATVTEDGAIKAIYQTGLHRTDTELARRAAATTTTAGVSAGYQSSRFRLALNILHVHWGGKRLLRATGTKNIPSLTNIERISHVSSDYSYLFGRGEAEFFGECARASNGAVGLINGFRYTHALAGDYSVIFRYIPAEYWSYYTGAFAHFSRPNNEKGLMGKASWNFRHGWGFRAYADYYGSFDPRYGRKERTKALFWLTEGTKNTSNLSWTIRLRGLHDNAYRRSTAIKLKGRYTLGQDWNISASVQLCRNRKYDAETNVWETPTQGKSISIRADYKGEKWLRVFSLDAAAFNTDSYTDRIYESVRNPRYMYTSAFFYGEGFRLGMLVRTAPTSRIELESRINHLIRRDTDSIGSDGELIQGRSRTQLFMTIRYR